MNDLAAARAEAERALAAAPQSADAQAIVAWLALQAGDLPVAIAHYRRAVALDGNHRVAWAGLGASLQHAGELVAAHEAFTVCVAVEPRFAEDWCNLGGVCAALGRLAEAASAYRRATACAASFSPAWQGLVWALVHAGKDAERQAAIAAWARACPDSPTARHLLRAQSAGPAPDRCEPAFVAEHFDQFAKDYDRVLHDLDTTIAASFAAICRETGVTWRRALDVGCGTGAASEWLAGPDRRLVGVDLSPRMLAIAGGRGRYEELHCGDALTFLASSHERFDLIVLADVLPYFGDTAPLLAAVAHCLLAGGHVLLSHEHADAPGYHLVATGRFQHHPVAIASAATAAGLPVRTSRSGPLRREAGRPVPGWCTLLQKATPP